MTDPNNTSAGPHGTIFRADGSTQAVSASYVAPPCPVIDGSLLEAAYDPFTGHFLFLSEQGSTVRLAQVPLCTLQSCAAGSYFVPGTDDIALFQVNLSGVGGAQGLTVGEDGNLYAGPTQTARRSCRARAASSTRRSPTAARPAKHATTTRRCSAARPAT